MNENDRKIAYLLIFIAVFSVSWASIFVRLTGASGVICATWRLVFSTIITWTMLILLGKIDELRTLNNRAIILSILSGISLAIHFASWMESLFLLSVSISVTLVVTYPLITALIERFILGEKIKIIQWIGMMLAFLGVVALSFTSVKNFSNNNDTNSFLGVILALIGAFTAAVYFTIGRMIRKRISTITYTSITYASAALILLAFSTSMGYNLTNYNSTTWIYFLLLAIVPMLGGHSILNYLLKYIKASIITATVLGEPVGASILAILILNEILPIHSYIYMMITIIGIFIVLYNRD